MLASLNHPNIAQIHGLEESGDSPALVLEYVPGPTLQDRIAKGPIPLDEALPIARQIAEALEAAHEQGIIHRDLKPANVKVKDDGTVKVLDFGLAKALGPDLSDAEAANSPTMTMTAAATKMGVIMGTAAYMSPEQAAGKPADRRSDNWSFGVVLWEMLTGRQLFVGESISHVLAAVLKTDPEWQDLPGNTPPSVRRLLRRCLERSPKKRLPDAAMARLEIDEADDGSASPAGGAMASIARSAFWQRPVPALLIVLGVALLTALAFWSFLRPASPPGQVARFTVEPPPFGESSTFLPWGSNVSISPDGTRVVYAVNDQLYLRALDEPAFTPIQEVSGPSPQPFFSPDGQWIAFVHDDQLKKVAVSGGAPVTLAESVGLVWGATWSTDGTIFLGGSSIRRVDAAGGTPETVVPRDEQSGMLRPQLLPGSEWLLFTSTPTGQVVIQSLVTGERRVLLDDGGGDARYLSTGHLAYVLEGTLLAVPFDAESLTLTPGPVPLVEGIVQTPTGSASVSVSDNGSLVYLTGLASGGHTAVWVDRDGHEEPLDLILPAMGLWSRVSPDGTRIALSFVGVGGESDVWVADLNRGTLSRVTTYDGIDNVPIWTPDGQRLVFASSRTPADSRTGAPPPDGFLGFYTRAADGTGPVEHLITSEHFGYFMPYDWSPDGNSLIFDYGESGGASDAIGIMDLDGERSWRPLLNTAAAERSPALSPDGAWIAYASNQSGQFEVYVERFPDLGGRQQVSTGGGNQPVWAPDGGELFYRNGPKMMAVAVDGTERLSLGEPVVLFEDASHQTSGTGVERGYDISPDGQRFMLFKTAGAEESEPPQIHVVLNWTQELLERVPVP